MSFGEERPPSESSRARRRLRTVRGIGVFGVNSVGLGARSPVAAVGVTGAGHIGEAVGRSSINTKLAGPRSR